MQHSDWLNEYLARVSSSCEEGRSAVEYIRTRKTKVGFKRARKSVGAFWTLPGNIHFNALHYTYESTLAEPRAWTSLIHEARHLQQGWLTALSVYGELDAWQFEFRVYKKLVNKPLGPVLEELISLSLNWDRDNLVHARQLMQTFAGKGYRIDLLPLFPLHKEITYRLTRKVPAEQSSHSVAG